MAFIVNEFVGDLVLDVGRDLIRVIKGSFLCRSTAQRLQRSVESLLPLIQGPSPQAPHAHGTQQHQHLGEVVAKLQYALDLARRAAASPRWNVYKSAQLVRRMEEVDKWISRWLSRHAPAQLLADVRRLRADADERIGSVERRVEEIAASVMAQHHPVVEAVAVTPPAKWMGLGFGEELGVVGAGVGVGREKVKEMVMGGAGWEVVGIAGIGGSGKTTLAMEICRDHQVRGQLCVLLGS